VIIGENKPMHKKYNIQMKSNTDIATWRGSTAMVEEVV